MNCEKVNDLISDHIDGCLSESLCVELEMHFQVCEVCADKLESTRCVVHMLGQLSCSKTPVDCWAGVQRQILDKQMIAPVWKRLFLRPVVAVPAFAVLILALFILLPSQAPQPKINLADNVEYSHFISAHSRLQRLQPLSDHDATFVAAEIENASYSPDVSRQ